jgi:hypothetical protein
MRSSDHFWQLSYEELAHKCQEMGHASASAVDPSLREEARRIYGGWTDAFSLDKHANDAEERFAAATASLRKRTIELLVKAEQTVR